MGQRKRRVTTEHPGGPWTSREVVAWTERDGPGRPPRGPGHGSSLVLAGALATVFVGLLATDAVCAHHRAWVDGLALTALVAAVASIAGLVRGWAAAPLLTVVTALAGVGIGLIDAIHAPTRGRAIALAFGIVVVLASLLAARAAGVLRWQRESMAPDGDDAVLVHPAAPSAAPHRGTVDVERTDRSAR
jgi:hypothetical protein